MSLITALSQLFSKPESKHQLGVAIGQTSLMFCYLPENAEINYQEVNLELNLSQNLSAEAATKAVTESLMKLSTDHQVSGGCHLVLPASHYQIVQIDKPSVPDNEIAAALKWQVKDLVTIAVDDMIVDYFDGPTLAGGNAKLNVVCASKSFLTAMVSTINQGELLFKTISTEEFAFVSLLPKQDDAVLLVCQQPNEEVILLIVKKGKLYFHRRLRGFAQIANKNQQELTMGVIDSLSLEIQRSLDYFERQLKQAPIKSIQVIVPMDNEDFLVEKLGQNTHISVQLLDLPEQHQGQRQFAAAIGASLLNTLEQNNES